MVVISRVGITLIASLMIASLMVASLMVASLVAGCATPPTTTLPAPTTSDTDRTVQHRVAHALPHVPPIALSPVDSPGYHVEDLTARLRQALGDASGVRVVDQLAVRAEIASCSEMPCPDTQQQLFADARYVATCSLGRVGNVFIGSLRVLEDGHAIVQANETGENAATVVQNLGRKGGIALRTHLTQTAEQP